MVVCLSDEAGEWNPVVSPDSSLLVSVPSSTLPGHLTLESAYPGDT